MSHSQEGAELGSQPGCLNPEADSYRCPESTGRGEAVNRGAQPGRHPVGDPETAGLFMTFLFSNVLRFHDLRILAI